MVLMKLISNTTLRWQSSTTG